LGRSGFDVHHADDGEGVGGGVDARFEKEVEGEGIFWVGAGHVDIDTVALWGCEWGQGEVVGGEGADRVIVKEVAKYGLRSDDAIVGVSAAEELVDEEECWGVFAESEDGVEALDLGEKFGFALGE